MTTTLSRRAVAALALIPIPAFAGAPPMPSADDTRLTLERYAAATGHKLKISFEPISSKSA